MYSSLRDVDNPRSQKKSMSFVSHSYQMDSIVRFSPGEITCIMDGWPSGMNFDFISF